MPVIALLTDFGTKDYFVGAMKGVILSIDEAAKITDITHEIEPQNIKAASFILRACYADFPAKTIFVSVVDPGVGSDRKAILVETADYFFIAPDNGLLSFIFNSRAGNRREINRTFANYRVFELTGEKFFNRRKTSNSFHGRDIFAPVAAHLSNGVKPAEFGREIDDFVVFDENEPRKISENLIEAEIIHIDRFGNLITNLKREDLPGKFAVEIGAARITKICGYFAESEPDEVFMIFGSAGFLEIAARDNSAARILQIAGNTKISVKNEL